MGNYQVSNVILYRDSNETKLSFCPVLLQIIYVRLFYTKMLKLAAAFRIYTVGSISGSFEHCR